MFHKIVFMLHIFKFSCSSDFSIKIKFIFIIFFQQSKNPVMT